MVGMLSVDRRGEVMAVFVDMVSVGCMESGEVGMEGVEEAERDCVRDERERGKGPG